MDLPFLKDILLSLAVVGLVIVLIRAPWRSKYQQARDLDALFTFIHEHSCQYVAIFCTEDLVGGGGDDGSAHFFVTVVATDPFGGHSTYREKTGTASMLCMSDLYYTARRENQDRARKIHEEIKGRVNTEHPFLVTLRIEETARVDC